MNKALKVFLIILGCILGLILLVYIALSIYSAAHYSDYWAVSERSFEIGGIDEGFVPQGMTYDEEMNLFITSGYMKDGSASRVYIQSEDGQVCRYFELTNPDGTPHATHLGGCATDGTTFWLADDDMVYSMSLNAALSMGDGAELTLTDEMGFAPHCVASFAYCDGEKLYVGEFHGHEYATDASHTITAPDGEEHNAIMCVYKTEAMGDYGLESATPEAVVSIPDLAQGFAIADGRPVLSTSYSIWDSHIYVYSGYNQRRETFDIGGQAVPLLYLDSSTLEETVTATPMTEGLVWKDGKLYILYESACNKYLFGKFFFDGRYVYKTELFNQQP